MVDATGAIAAPMFSHFFSAAEKKIGTFAERRGIHSAEHPKETAKIPPGGSQFP
jgi:hypothetical protein